MKYLFFWNVNMFFRKGVKWIWVIKLNLGYFIVGFFRDFILLMCIVDV